MYSAQQRDVRLGGKVFINYNSVAGKTSFVRLMKRYMPHFKVILIQQYFTTEEIITDKNKRSFCANDKKLFEKYKARISYTNADGYFEFRGLQRQANYILIFCERTIQVTEVQTGNSYVTYGIKEKLIKL